MRCFWPMGIWKKWVRSPLVLSRRDTMPRHVASHVKGLSIRQAEAETEPWAKMATSRLTLFQLQLWAALPFPQKGSLQIQVQLTITLIWCNVCYAFVAGLLGHLPECFAWGWWQARLWFHGNCCDCITAVVPWQLLWLLHRSCDCSQCLYTTRFVTWIQILELSNPLYVFYV